MGGNVRRLVSSGLAGLLLVAVLASPVGMGAAPTVQFPAFSYPNPFNIPIDKTVIVRFSLAVTAKVYILNLLGQTVATLPDAKILPTLGTSVWYAVWDGKDDNGTPVSSGMYFILVRGTKLDAKGNPVPLLERGKMTILD